MERWIDAVRCHHDLLRWNVVELDEISLGALRHREDARGASDCARNDAAKDEPVSRAEQAGLAFEREVVNGDDARAAQTQRERVLRVHEVGAEPSEQPRERDGHSEHLRARTKLDGLDAGGNELRTPGDAGEPEARCRGQQRQLAEQIAHVGLVAGPLAPENVGVDGDERHAISFQSAST